MWILYITSSTLHNNPRWGAMGREDSGGVDGAVAWRGVAGRGFVCVVLVGYEWDMDGIWMGWCVLR